MFFLHDQAANCDLQKYQNQKRILLEYDTELRYYYI